MDAFERLGTPTVARQRLPGWAKRGARVKVYGAMYPGDPDRLRALALQYRVGVITDALPSGDIGLKSRVVIRFGNGDELVLCAEMMLRRNVTLAPLQQEDNINEAVYAASVANGPKAEEHNRNALRGGLSN